MAIIPLATLPECDHANWGHEEGPNPWGLDPITHLAAYLSYWLATFVIPSKDTRFLRPEVIYPACCLACGVQLSIAPAALANVFHSLGILSNDPVPRQCRVVMATHYVSAWAGLLLPELVSTMPSAAHFTPLLLRFANCTSGNDVAQLRDARRILHSFPYTSARGLPLDHSSRHTACSTG